MSTREESFEGDLLDFILARVPSKGRIVLEGTMRVIEGADTHERRSLVTAPGTWATYEKLHPAWLLPTPSHSVFDIYDWLDRWDSAGWLDRRDSGLLGLRLYLGLGDINLVITAKARVGGGTIGHESKWPIVALPKINGSSDTVRWKRQKIHTGKKGLTRRKDTAVSEWWPYE